MPPTPLAISEYACLCENIRGYSGEASRQGTHWGRSGAPIHGPTTAVSGFVPSRSSRPRNTPTPVHLIVTTASYPLLTFTKQGLNSTPCASNTPLGGPDTPEKAAAERTTSELVYILTLLGKHVATPASMIFHRRIQMMLPVCIHSNLPSYPARRSQPCVKNAVRNGAGMIEE